MANPYQRIWENNQDVNTQLKLPQDMLGADPEDSPGRRILVRAFALASPNMPTFQHLYTAFIEQQFQQNWTWNPSASSGSNAYGLLDGTKLSGECLHFAKNLWFLARAPAPYGLGISHNDVSTYKYEGATGNGFVSEHNGTFMGLRPNVTPTLGYLGAPLYSWGDHKTVRWNAQLWDPCYKKIYANAAAMALYEGTNVTVRTDADSLLPMGMEAMTIINQGKSAEKTTRNARYYYFRRVALTEGRGAHIHYEGPIDETKLELMRMSSRGLVIKKL